MPFFIGTDEAGYGPNLGPLTVTGTLWSVTDPEIDLYQSLAAAVTNQSKRSGDNPARIQIADSKQVYSSSGSIRNLETSVLALLRSTSGRIPTDWQELVELICPLGSRQLIDDQFWLDGQATEIPFAAQANDIELLSDAFSECCQQEQIRLVDINCVPIFPPQFNSQVQKLGNKATLLSVETLKIIRSLLDQADDDVEVGCDKHGGRSKYAALIQQFLTQQAVNVGRESGGSSDYSFRENDRDVVVRFQAKGESFLPTAVASMVSKYAREVFMAHWNAFWQSKQPGLKPTKGYPVDAKRFKQDIREVQAALGIQDHLIWRTK